MLTSPSGPTTGPVAAVLAMSAPITTALGHFWNSPEYPDNSTVETMVDGELHLARQWQINSAGTWLHAADRLTRGERIRVEPAEIALDIRDAELEQNGAAHLGVDAWVEAVRRHGERLGWDQEQTESVVRCAVKTFHVERQLHADGLLPDDERLVTLFAYDLTAAAFLLHSGVRMRYADAATIETMLDALWHNASTAYRDWASFGASYIAASSMLLGGYPTDSHYEAPATTVDRLLSSPTSPWTAVAFPSAG